jgi:hypothetical protein
MDNGTAERLIESNTRLIAAMGLHWENVKITKEGHPVPYGEADFHNLAYKHY